MKKYFTIIELLVAITIAVVITNILSSLYLRSSDLAVRQAGALSAINKAEHVIEYISNDFEKMSLASESNVAPNRRSPRLYSVVARDYGDYAPRDFSSIFTEEGWPYSVFTAKRGGDIDVIKETVSGDSDGYQQIIYFLGPPLEISGAGDYSNGDKIDDRLMTLYRGNSSSIQGDRNIHALDEPANPLNPALVNYDFVVSSANILSEDVIYYSTIFEQDGIYSLSMDSNNDTFSTGNPIPSSIKILLTVAPNGAYYEFSDPSGALNIGVYKNYTESGTTAAAVNASVLEKVKPFRFDSEGFFFNLSSPGVFYYVYDGSEISVYAVSASGASTIGADDILVTGKSVSRMLQVQ